ncbi:small integral membrane protein 26-like [Aulostomus maculatus]
MTFKEVFRWSKRASIVYAIGVWTMLGSYGYYVYTGRFDEEKPQTQEVQEDPKQVVYQSGNFKTIIIYKKDFVPYTERISNFLQSFSSGPGTKDKDE